MLFLFVFIELHLPRGPTKPRLPRPSIQRTTALDGWKCFNYFAGVRCCSSSLSYTPKHGVPTHRPVLHIPVALGSQEAEQCDPKVLKNSNGELTATGIFLVQRSKCKGNPILNKLPSPHTQRYRIFSSTIWWIHLLLFTETHSLANTGLCSCMMRKLQITALKILFLMKSRRLCLMYISF